jgi:hypothetical protein
MAPPFENESSTVEDEAGIMPSHGISIDLPSTGDGDRPSNVRHMYGRRIPFPFRT